MRGAAILSRLSNAIVVDVGGTTTDVGCLKAGFPREANSTVEIGGVRTLFRMPDLLSLGLGGGTVVDADTGTVGPESVGNQLTTDAMVFGGSEHWEENSWPTSRGGCVHCSARRWIA
jgi:N-methylhydantoinase A/oxoprolinase/acetone carboxylase beta subunit